MSEGVSRDSRETWPPAQRGTWPRLGSEPHRRRQRYPLAPFLIVLFILLWFNELGMGTAQHSALFTFVVSFRPCAVCSVVMIADLLFILFW